MMTSRLVILLAVGLLMASAGSGAMAAPEPEAEASESQGHEEATASDQSDPGVRAGKVGDDELPEGVRMLGEREDPTVRNAGADDEKILCKRMKVTGSRITTQRVCKTRREWRMESEAASRGVRQQQDSNQKGTPQG